MFKLFVIVVFLQNGTPAQVQAEHQARFETLADCMAEAATLALDPEILALQASCVPIEGGEDV
jgi:hypothetical protein